MIYVDEMAQLLNGQLVCKYVSGMINDISHRLAILGWRLYAMQSAFYLPQTCSLLRHTICRLAGFSQCII